MYGLIFTLPYIDYYYYPEGSLFMDVENRSFKELKLLAKQKGHWSELVDGLTR